MYPNEEHGHRVIAFMDSWLSYAKNPAAVECPVSNMHIADRNYYTKRILLHHQIAERIERGEFDGLSELNAIEQKYSVITSDFDDLFRKVHGMQRE